ncbi:MAG: phospho-N-acetylmuramoyl-pentapeptide-transferase [Deltaproteobacteria bacterium]|nr:phospho-N-acetylmuramoyl-pentapeptide-transferase [Deltaproteobacteria bacterium]
MLYHFLYKLTEVWFGFNVFRYITFRTAIATLTALILSFVLGPWLIRRLTQNQIEQSIRTDGPKSHQVKKGTPTMGGTLVLCSIVTATLLWADLKSLYLGLVLLVTVAFGMIGFIDDYLKVIKKNSRGLPGRYKLGGQFLIALAVAIILYGYSDFPTTLDFPFFKKLQLDLGLFYIPFAALVIVGASNAVNLTDGLDGLAMGPIMIAGGTYLIFSYVAGHTQFADYLQIRHVGGAGELAVFCGALIGAGLGFLWFNAYPAQMFMGDVGSLPLGGALGTIAVVTKQELLLVLVGGVFVVEALSVIVQVVSYQWRGKRVFQMAPIHHHFELKGWAEPKIVVRVWIVSIILSLLALSALKLR